MSDLEELGITDEDTKLVEEELELVEEEIAENKQEEPEKPVLDKEEELALKNGWKPKEEYEGNPDDWRTAKQFNDHARMIAKIKSQDRDLDNLKKYMQLQEKQTHEAARAQAVQELADAKELGDFEAYEEAKQKQEKAEAGLGEVAKIDNEEIERMFFERNQDWFDPQNTTQMAEVYEIAKAVTQDYPNTTVMNAMEIVERRIFDAHPEYRRTRAGLDSPVVSNTNSAVNKGVVANKGNSKNFNSLPVNLQREYESMRRSLEKTMKIEYTKEEYIQGLKDIGAV